MRSPFLTMARAFLPLAGAVVWAILLALPATAYPTRTTWDRSFPAYGSGPFVLADLGGSSWTDLAAIDGNRSTVWVYNGSAQGIAPYPSFNIPIPGVRDLATGDFDGDGRTDLIATDGQHVLGFAHNLLAAPAIVLDAPGAGRVALGDFNSDAREDLAVLGATGARIFFQQSGPERFTSNASVDVADGIAFQSLAVGDLSGDGRDDLALGKWGEVRVYLQTAEGLLNLDPIAFSPSTSGPITLGVAAMSDVTDLVVTTSGQSGSVRLWRWGGTSFAADVTFPGPFTSGVAIGDVNDDRRVDIAVARLDGSVDIFLQQSGSFGAPVPDVVLAAASGTGGEWVGIGDVNADGFADVLVRSQNPDVFLLYLQEDAMPALIRPIPSTYVVNRGTSAKGLIDLRQFFVDDHNRLTFAVTYESEPGHLRATVDGAGLDFESEGSWFGTAEFRVTAWDGNPNHPAIESNAFTVLVNDPPRITSAPVLRATAGAAYGYLLAVEDDYPANDAHTFALLTAPEGMRVDASTGLLEWTPAAGQVGEFAVEVQVQDANGGVAVQSFTIVVSASGVGSPGILLAVGVAASSAALLAAAALLNENAKFAFLLFFLPLYTKIKRERVLDHFVRGQIFGYIQANPGEHYNAIKEALGLTNGSLAHHLRTLEREQFIKSKRYGLYRRFYPMNYRMPADDVYQPNEIQTTILAVIREHPGITQKEIAGRLTLTPPTVNYHIAVLSHRRLILVERRGRSTHCTIIEGAST